MPFAWSMLRNPQPTTLVAARMLAHRAAQWPARAARANLEPAADDSHSSLSWDADTAALLSQPMRDGIRVGLRIAVHELVFVNAEHVESHPVAGHTDAEVGAWLDGRLGAAGLAPAAPVKLPYEMPPSSLGRARDEAPRLAALAGWFAAGAEILEELRAKHQRFKPGPARCWPHHFDIAVLVELDGARSIGIGLSPGDDYYAQPYFYLSPYPKPDTAGLPPLPPGGRWHTEEFFGAVATGVDVLALPDPRTGLGRILDAAFEESLKRLEIT